MRILSQVYSFIISTTGGSIILMNAKCEVIGSVLVSYVNFDLVEGSIFPTSCVRAVIDIIFNSIERRKQDGLKSR